MKEPETPTELPIGLLQIEIKGTPVVSVGPPSFVHYVNEYWKVLGIFGDEFWIMSGDGDQALIKVEDITTFH